MRLWFWLCLAAGAAISQAVLWLTRLPLGIPGEWTWHRVASEPDAAWNLALLALSAGLYVAFVEAGAIRLRADRPARTLRICGWLAALVAVSAAWLWVVQESAPLQNRLGKSAFVLYYPSSSGYFTKARYDSPDPATLLSGYEDLMREGDVLHVGTHPPGLFLVFHGLIGACRSPALAAVLDATQPLSFREACDVIAGNSQRSVPFRPLLAGDRRVLWLATLLVLAAAALVPLPLFALSRRTLDAASAWRTAALWPAIPAIAVFTPKSDVAYAFVGLLMVWAWLSAVDRRSLLLALVAGLLAWCGLMMSLAFLPVLLFMAIAGWRAECLRCGACPDDGATGGSTSGPIPAPVDGPAGGRRGSVHVPPPWQCLAGGAVGFLVPTVLLYGCCRINLLAVWGLNFQNHAAFYAKYTRTYWQWLLVNPVELSFAAGWPVLLLAALCLVAAARSRRLFATPAALGVVLVWGSLWLTGKNSGEAARLWIVFLPWLVWLAGLQLAELDRLKESGRFRPSTAILVLQLAVCALTVARVSGFEISQ